MLYRRLEEMLQIEHGTVASLLDKAGGYEYRRIAVSRGDTLRMNRAIGKKRREVLAPSPRLKTVQEKIRCFVSGYFRPHPIAHGYVTGRSIITNAGQHVGANSILNVDFVDFFGSIAQSVVRERLRALLTDVATDDVDTIVTLCCHDGCLPQGSPASPLLSNLVCYPLDAELQVLAHSLGCAASRFSDDISISTPAPRFPTGIAFVSPNGLIREIKLSEAFSSLIQGRGFEVNFRKLRFQARPERLLVTGLTITDRVSLPREALSRIRAILFQWRHHGIEATVRRYHRHGDAAAFSRAIRGYIAFVGQVMGRDNRHYQGFLASFEALTVRDRDQDAPRHPTLR